MTRRPPATTHELADELRCFVIGVFEDAVATWLPGFRVPRSMAGLRVGDDARADIAFTVGLLAEQGVTEIAGVPVVDAIVAATADLVGEMTDTFFSYRVSETLARFGPADDNAVLRAVDARQRDELLAATDSSSREPMLDDGRLPPNYVAVLARCALSRAVLLGDDAAPTAAALAARTSDLLAATPLGLLDDTRDGLGRYDIYAADIVLFTETFSTQLGAPWERAARAALALVEAVVGGDGTAVPWGRSTGALGRCLTIELAALVAGAPVLGTAPPAWWAGAAATAFDHLRAGWFDGGLIRSHHGRSPYGYRGPHRWAQMTFDVLGKLAWASGALRAAPDHAVDTPWRRAMRDEFFAFESARPLGVWSHRSERTTLVLPVTGAVRSDYLPVPREPGWFETPVDSELAVGVPLVVDGTATWIGGGVPVDAVHVPGRLTVTWDRLVPTGRMDIETGTPTYPCRRTAVTTLDGRSVSVWEHLEFTERVPNGLSVAVPECEGRPLRVEFSSDRPHTVATFDTAGMKSWRSYWGELPAVHQVDVDPAPVVDVRWTVTPKLRVLSFHHGHHYQRSLYASLADRVVDADLPRDVVDDPDELARMLGRFDVFHMHWPEWFLGADVDRNRRFVGSLRSAGIPVVWTQHNLVPHSRDPRMQAAYDVWAEAADVVLHHSRWGMARVLERLPFRPDAVHAVVPHGHFGNLAPVDDADRASRRRRVESELGLRSGVLRLGVVGAPRPEKDVQSVIDAVHACRRDDVELLLTSSRGDEVVPDDARIHVLAYDLVTRSEYEARLSAVDVLVLPFHDGELLTTGTVGDVVAHGIPALTGPWPFLTEVLGDAAIPYGSSVADLTATVESLDRPTIERAAAASVALRPRYDWATVAELLWAQLEGVWR